MVAPLITPVSQHHATYTDPTVDLYSGYQYGSVYTADPNQWNRYGKELKLPSSRNNFIQMRNSNVCFPFQHHPITTLLYRRHEISNLSSVDRCLRKRTYL